MGSVACARYVETEEPVSVPRVRIVATERGPGGGRLVTLDESGVRTGNLTTFGAEVAVDTHPSFTADGSLIAFASSRGRKSVEKTHLWLVEAALGKTPVQLTRGPAVDRDPVWAGGRLYYASNAGGTFDIWALRFARKDGQIVPAGRPQQLTTGKGDELSPSPSPDGKKLVYMARDTETGTARLEVLTLEEGTVKALTKGPADLTPAWSPDGKKIAFSGPVRGRNDTDIYWVDAKGGEPQLFVDESYADQTAPVWSPSGRYIFATSVYRSVSTGRPVLSSIVAADVNKKKWHALHDPTAVDSRWGVGLTGEVSGKITQNTLYVSALRRAIEQQLNQHAR